MTIHLRMPFAAPEVAVLLQQLLPRVGDLATFVQPLTVPAWSQAQVTVAVLRLDLLDPLINGNKPFKLLLNLRRARQQGYHDILSFGGHWSNHLHALAAAGQRLGFSTIGLVRGHEQQPLTACLQDCQRLGMQLQFVPPSRYRAISQQQDQPELSALHQALVVPEGGANLDGVRGAQLLGQWLRPLVAQYPNIMLPVATGSTLAGLAAGLGPQAQLDGVVVLKGMHRLAADVAQWLDQLDCCEPANWRLLDRYHHGGYARSSPQLRQFVTQFTQQHGLPLELVYSGKLLFAVDQMIGSGAIAAGGRILLIHTGGLQGGRGQWAE